MSARVIAGSFVAVVAALMAVALYMQYVMLLPPCPLCMMQRIWLCLAGVVALLAFMHGKALRTYAGVTALCCAIGAGFSLRQLYLQSLPPDQVPACGPDLEYMLEAFPLADVLKAMIMGTGNCALVDWSLFGISIAGYMLIGFIGLIAVAALQFRVAGRALGARAPAGIR